MHTPQGDTKFLENTARSQLQRFGSSSENLRLVLGRRIKRSARAQGTDRTEGRAYTGANPEFAAAVAYVRRRWLGLYRPEGECRIMTLWR